MSEAELGLTSAADRSRLVALVRDKVYGRLHQCKLVEESEDERIFIVLWADPTKFGRDTRAGTHRACLSKVNDEAMLVWGSYFDGIGAYEQAVEDFRSRSSPRLRARASSRDRDGSPLERLGAWLVANAGLREEPTHEEVDCLLDALSESTLPDDIAILAEEARDDD